MAHEYGPSLSSDLSLYRKSSSPTTTALPRHTKADALVPEKLRFNLS